MNEDVIARRVLTDGGRTYEVRINRPRYDEQAGDYVCTWSLTDDSGAAVVSSDIWGVDALQALINAIAIMGDRLAVEPYTLSWNGLPGPGLPRHVDPKTQPGIISIFTDSGNGS